MPRIPGERGFWISTAHMEVLTHTQAQVKCVCDTASYATTTNFLVLMGDKTDGLQRQVSNSSETRCFRQHLSARPTSSPARNGELAVVPHAEAGGRGVHATPPQSLQGSQSLPKILPQFPVLPSLQVAPRGFIWSNLCWSFAADG